MKKFFADFKEFAMKGNIIDMAVGVIIGGAFGKIVTALVENIIMPLITLLTGGVAVSDWKWVITAADEANGVAENALAYGLFIQAIIDFLLIALSIFVALKVIMKAKSMFEKKEEEAEEEAPAETTEDILKDIRAALTGKTDEEE